MKNTSFDLWVEFNLSLIMVLFFAFLTQVSSLIEEISWPMVCCFVHGAKNQSWLMNLSTSLLEAMWSQGRKQQFCFCESKLHSEVGFGRSFIKFLWHSNHMWNNRALVVYFQLFKTEGTCRFKCEMSSRAKKESICLWLEHWKYIWKKLDIVTLHTSHAAVASVP